MPSTSPTLRDSFARSAQVARPALPALAALLLVALPAIAQTPSDLQRCRELKDAAARLACYDAIPLSASAPAARAPAASAPAAAPSTVAPASTSAPARGAAAAPAEFGFERRAEQKREEVKAIESRITGKVDGWEPNTRFTLDNGQVWQVSDDSRAFGNATNPKVRVSRGTFGTFFLEIEGINAAPRVKRVR